MKKMKKTKKMNEQDEEGEKEEEKMRKKSQSANSIPVPGSPAKAPLYNREGGREGRGGRVGGWGEEMSVKQRNQLDISRRRFHP